MSAKQREQERLARLRVDSLRELRRLAKEQTRYANKVGEYDYLIQCCKATIASCEEQLNAKAS